MDPTITIATHNMTKKIEYEPLTWYPANAVVDPDTGEILQYKDLIKVKEQKTRYFWKNELSKEFGRLTDGFPGKGKKGMNTIRFVARNNIPVGHTVTY